MASGYDTARALLFTAVNSPDRLGTEVADVAELTARGYRLIHEACTEARCSSVRFVVVVDGR